MNSANQQSRSAGFYRPELDVLRFFAFFGVFIRHSVPDYESFYSRFPLIGWLAPVFKDLVISGALGVDLFFVLSAYLITELLLREKEQRGVLTVSAFYVRRILRIWPLYFFFIVFAAALAYVLPALQHLSVGYISTFLLLSGNWYCVLKGFPKSVIAPLWSVSVEEQFYLLWPLAVRRAAPKIIGIIAVCMLIVANVCRFVLLLHHANQTQLWTNTLTRLDPIACGILLSLWLRNRSYNPHLITRAVMLLSGVSCWVITAQYANAISRDPGLASGMVGYPLAAIGAVLIFLAVYGSADAGISLARNPALTYLGRISYGLYVYHQAALLITRVLMKGKTGGSIGRTAAAWIIAFVVTVTISAISYRFLESPFLRLKKRFTFVPSRPVNGEDRNDVVGEVARVQTAEA